MANLTTERDTRVREVDHLDWMPVAANTILYAGEIIAKNAAGYAVPAGPPTTNVTAGRAEHTVDNRGGADGDKKVTYRRGVFRLDNSGGGDAITIADRFSQVYMVDDHTVGKTDGGGTRPRAGMVTGIEPAGVWVNVNTLMGT